MWSARPVGWLCRKYVVEGEGDHVASLEFGSWSERGTIELDDERLEIVREGFWSPRFHLRRDGRRLATSRSSGAFRRGFVIDHDGEEYRLEPTSWLARSYRLVHRRRDLGRIQSQGFLARHFAIELDPSLAPELRLFAFWLNLLAMRRAAAAAAS